MESVRQTPPINVPPVSVSAPPEPVKVNDKDKLMKKVAALFLCPDCSVSWSSIPGNGIPGLKWVATNDRYTCKANYIDQNSGKERTDLLQRGIFEILSDGKNLDIKQSPLPCKAEGAKKNACQLASIKMHKAHWNELKKNKS